ncbi:hypothetical protein Bca52824_078026 [Brassica carinata]|uniref:Oxidoreductase N-terminal domain-containing protein n=1 Tax=Brassica carinata TaxID=52824 RepID=A0A8X7PXW4_BRACI|nr:hypothetical protein Bca52824_078026 [Brassica carinata]
METTVRNKQVILKHYINGFPEESDLMIVTAPDTMELKVKPGSSTILVKNLFLSCDPYMGTFMREPDSGSSEVAVETLSLLDAGNRKLAHAKTLVCASSLRSAKKNLR